MDAPVTAGAAAPVTATTRAARLRPVYFKAWSVTCAHLSAAIADGPGLVLLVGPEGSGKSYTFAALATGVKNRAINIRRPDEEPRPETAVDMVDPIGAGPLDTLVTPAFMVVRVLAVRPEQLEAVLDRCPNARVVPMRPMTQRDVRMFVDARRSQMRRSADARTLRAIAALTSFGLTNPGVLDHLIEEILGGRLETDARQALPGRSGAAAPTFADLQGAAPHAFEAGPDFALEPDRPERSDRGERRGARWDAASAAFASELGGRTRGIDPPRAVPFRFADQLERAFQPMPYGSGWGGKDVQSRARRPRQADQTFEATSWDMLKSSPADIVQGHAAAPRPRRPYVQAIAGVAVVFGVGAVYALSGHRENAAVDTWAPASVLAATSPSANVVLPVAVAMPVPLPTYAVAEAGSIGAAVPASPADDVAPGAVEASGSAGRSTIAAEVPRTKFATAAMPEERPVPIDTPVAQPPRSGPVTASAVPPTWTGTPEPVATQAPAPTLPEPALHGGAVASPSDRVGPAPHQASTEAAAKPDVVPRPAPPEDATHLLRLGKALLSIGQQADGRRLLEASADLGNTEARAILAGKTHARSGKADGSSAAPPRSAR